MTFGTSAASPICKYNLYRRASFIMLTKNSYEWRPVSPESSQIAKQPLHPSQALLGLINRQDANTDKMYMANPPLHPHQPETRPNHLINTRKQWNSPPKKFPDKLLENKSAHESQKSVPKFSPESRKGNQDSQQRRRLSFKKSSPKHSRVSGSHEKQDLEKEVILSLKEIKRLREVIQTLIRDNKKLKKITHEVLEGKLKDWAQFGQLQYNRYYEQTTFEDRHRLNAQAKNNINTLNSPRASSPNTQTIEAFRVQNCQLIEQISSLRRSVESLTASKTHLQQETQHLRQSLSKYQVINKQLIQENSTLKSQYTSCSRRILELEDKIAQLQILNQSDLRFSKWTVESKYLDDRSQDDSQISFVQQKITNNGCENSLTKLESLLHAQQLNYRNQLSRVCLNYENMIAELLSTNKRADRKAQKNDESINTKESQTATDIVQQMQRKKELQYQIVRLVLKMSNKEA